MWSACHEGICTIVPSAKFIPTMKFAEWIMKEKSLPKAINNLNAIKQNMAIKLLEASGIVSPHH